MGKFIVDTIDSRLEEIKYSLTAKQALILWMEVAHKFGSIEEYCTWLVSHEEEPPINQLSKQVESAFRERVDGTPEALESAINRELRELAFLYFLQLRANQGFAAALGALKLRAAFEAAHLITASRERRSKRTPRTAADDPLGTSNPSGLAFEVLGHKGVVEDVAKKYFDGHPVLFKDLAEELAKLVEAVRTIRDGWNRLALREERYHKRKGRGVGAGHEYRVHSERIRVLEERFSFKYSESLIDSAKADALSSMCEDQDAFELARQSWLRHMKREEVDLDPESAG